MKTTFRSCVLAFIILNEYTLAYDYRIHTPIGMFKLGRQIGEGSYGKVKRGVYMKTQMDVAIKIETDDHRDEGGEKTLPKEKRCYDDIGAQLGIPQILYYGDHEDGEERIMIMEMLGLNLDKIFIESNYHFSIEKIHWISKQLIDRIETVHKSGWVFVDVKPENFAIGKYDTWLIYIFDEKQINITSSPHYVEDKNEIVLNSIVPHIDFGLSQKYLNKNGTHIEPGLPALYGPGTIEFMSRNAHKNQILSRRDDIEGIGYLILYFMRGTLPWTEDLGTDDYHGVSDVVHQKKVDFRAESLGGHAAKLAKYFDYTSTLDFKTEPDYKYLRQILDEMLSS